MTAYLVVWLTVSQICPFGLGWLNPELKAYVCREDRGLHFEAFDPARWRQAQRRLEDLGPDSTAVLLEIKGPQARSVAFAWRDSLTVERGN